MAPALVPLLADSDVYIAFSARQALRRLHDWKAVAEGLKSKEERVRAGALLTLEGVYEGPAAEALADYARSEAPVAERARALSYLAEVHRRALPWDGRWWGTRPTQGKPPAKVETWESTGLVLKTVRSELADPQAPLRAAAVAALIETGDKESLPLLRDRFQVEPEVDVRRDVALALGKLDDREALALLVAALKNARRRPSRSARRRSRRSRRSAPTWPRRRSWTFWPATTCRSGASPASSPRWASSRRRLRWRGSSRSCRARARPSAPPRPRRSARSAASKGSRPRSGRWSTTRSRRSAGRRSGRSGF